MQEAQKELQAQHAAVALTGVALRFSAERLVMRCEVGKATAATLRVHGSGSAAVRFHWTARTCRLPLDRMGEGGEGQQAGEGAAGVPRAAADAPAGGCPAQGSPFLMCRHRGAVLPGHDVEFEFVFRPQRAGVAISSPAASRASVSWASGPNRVEHCTVCLAALSNC